VALIFHFSKRGELDPTSQRAVQVPKMDDALLPSPPGQHTE